MPASGRGVGLKYFQLSLARMELPIGTQALRSEGVDDTCHLEVSEFRTYRGKVFKNLKRSKRRLCPCRLSLSFIIAQLF